MASKFNYAGVQNTSIKLIEKFGRLVTRNVTSTSGDEWNPTPSTITSTITAVFTNYSRNEIDNTLILSTDKKLLCYVELNTNDTITDDGITYNIVAKNARKKALKKQDFIQILKKQIMK